jgi:hypothetical protein
VVYDCHSIRSRIPFLFDGRLPDFNIGTNEGRTCAPADGGRRRPPLRGAQGYTSVLNGRFKGGWTTRHYGRPEAGVHAIQMELAQSPTSPPRRRPSPMTTPRPPASARPPPRRPSDARRHRPFPERNAMTNPRHNLRDVYPPTGPEITPRAG